MKGLINIKNNENKCFLVLFQTRPERIRKADKKVVNGLHYVGIEFSASKKDFSRIEQKNNICINVFC